MKKIVNLFENNRECFGGKPIAFDGVVDEKSFKKSEIKTLFLLKEVNYPDMNEDWRTFMEGTKNQASADSIYKTWPKGSYSSFILYHSVYFCRELKRSCFMAYWKMI